MSDQTQAPPEPEKQAAPIPIQAIASAKEQFEAINRELQLVTYNAEAMFAKQALQANDYLWKLATSNPLAVRDALISVAAIGLSLNPVLKYAYLIPRKNKICLDISYQGLLKLATDTGAIRWAKADIVYENDTFNYRGMSTKPEFIANVFKPRGNPVGVYCEAKTSDGDILVDVMTSDELVKIMESSESYRAWKKDNTKSCTWIEWGGEMSKKTILKRASKTWPKSERSERLMQAIDVINEHEGIDFSAPKEIEKVELINLDQEMNLTALAEEKTVSLDRMNKYFKVEKISDLPASKYAEAVSIIENYEAQNAAAQ